MTEITRRRSSRSAARRSSSGTGAQSGGLSGRLLMDFPLLQCQLQDLGYRADRMEAHLAAHVLRQVLEIGLVALREDDVGQAGGVRGQHLLLQAAYLQDLALQSHLTGHA